jgi:hypothetical protein
MQSMLATHQLQQLQLHSQPQQQSQHSQQQQHLHSLQAQQQQQLHSLQAQQLQQVVRDLKMKGHLAGQGQWSDGKSGSSGS